MINKKAFKEAKPKHYKKFHALDQKQMGQAVLRQKPIKAILSKVPKNERRQVIENVSQVFENAGGTYWDVPGKGKSVGISKQIIENPEKFRKLMGIGTRGILAHEGFHANRPVLGKSELLAHAYGGFKDKKNKGFKDVMKGVGRATQQIGHAVKTRPFRVGMELATVAGLSAAVNEGVKAVKGKIKDDKKKG
jgi:hypothetical protein